MYAAGAFDIRGRLQLSRTRSPGGDHDCEQVGLVETYAKEQGLWHDPDHEPDYSQTFELDLATVEPSIAGPKRPQDRIGLAGAQHTFRCLLAGEPQARWR